MRAEGVQVLGVGELDVTLQLGRPELGLALAGDEELEADPPRLAPHEVPVGLVVLEHEVERRPARLGRDAEAVLRADLLDDVRDRLVQERALLARAHHPVRLVVGAHHHRDAAGLEVGLDGDDLALEQRLRRAVLGRAELDLELGADLELGVVERLERVALGLRLVADGDRAAVRQPEPVGDLDLVDGVRLDVLDLGSVDEDCEERDGDARGLGRHQVSRFGMLSWVPRRRASGLSMPFASAIVRQRVASP